MISDMIFDLSEAEGVSYKADSADFENIYELIQEELFAEAREKCLEALKASILDVRYAYYAFVGEWISNKDFDIALEMLSDLLLIHQFYLSKADDGEIKLKLFIHTLNWMHDMMHKNFHHDIEKTVHYTGDKSIFLNQLQDYYNFIANQIDSTDLALVSKMQSEAQQLKEVRLENTLNQFADNNSSVGIKETTVESAQEVPSTNYTQKNQQQGDYAPQLRASVLWNNLIRDLNNFNQVIEQKDWVKGAVVKKILVDRISNFDVMKAFPDLFYPYLETSAKSYLEISALMSYSESHVWRLLEKMYRSSPESFISDHSIEEFRSVLGQQLNEKMGNAPQTNEFRNDLSSNHSHDEYSHQSHDYQSEGEVDQTMSEW